MLSVLPDRTAKRPGPPGYDGSDDRKIGKAVLLKMVERPSQVRASAAAEAAVARPEFKADGASSGRPTTRCAPDQPPSRNGEFPGGSRQPNRAKNFPELWTDAQRGAASIASVGQFGNQTQENVQADVFESVYRQGEPVATRPFDRWPALPEYPRSPVVNLTKASRDAERLRALDLEQQGGL
jgi:hypothetical protein